MYSIILCVCVLLCVIASKNSFTYNFTYNFPRFLRFLRPGIDHRASKMLNISCHCFPMPKATAAALKPRAPKQMAFLDELWRKVNKPRERLCEILKKGHATLRKWGCQMCLGQNLVYIYANPPRQNRLKQHFH